MSEDSGSPTAEQDSSTHGAGASTAYRVSAKDRVPPTEVWPEVFERIKELVADNHLKKSAPSPVTPKPSKAASAEAAAPAADDDEEEEEDADKVTVQMTRLRQRLRVEAEEATWRHFAHRAAVAMPSMRLLRRAELGHITLQHLRRWHVDVGSLVPAWLGEGLGGLMLVYAAHCCELVVRRAR